jgi:hypothetical protein
VEALSANAGGTWAMKNIAIAASAESLSAALHRVIIF